MLTLSTEYGKCNTTEEFHFFVTHRPKPLYLIITITFRISSKDCGHLPSLLLYNYLDNVFNFASWSAKPKIFIFCPFPEKFWGPLVEAACSR